MKSKNTLLIIMGLLIVAGLLVTGCTHPAAEIANPASVNCGKIGGTVDIKTNADGGQYGMCMFTNGTTCDEWALFRNEGCKPFVAPNATPAK